MIKSKTLIPTFSLREKESFWLIPTIQNPLILVALVTAQFLTKLEKYYP
jgi:hypothetical protein